MKKQLPLAIALGAGMMAIVSVAIVKAEPSAPDLPTCDGCHVFAYKDANAPWGVYDTRVDPGKGLTEPDTQTADGLWELSGASVTNDDLYIVIIPNWEVPEKFLIGGDLKANGETLNGIPTALWEDTSLIKGIFGDSGDYRFDTDVTKNSYRGISGDYRLWIRPNANAKAIVLHIDNRSTHFTSLNGWVWKQFPLDKFINVP